MNTCQQPVPWYIIINGYTAILLDVGPFFNFVIHTQLVGLLGQITPSQGLYIHTGKHKQNKRTHRR
jgi:hypothetical protein